MKKLNKIETPCILAAKCFPWCPLTLSPSTPSLCKMLGWGPAGGQGQCHATGQAQQQDSHPCHALPWLRRWCCWCRYRRCRHGMGLQAWVMQADYAAPDVCVGNAGRDAGEQVAASWCCCSVMGNSCQKKPPKQPPHTRRELLSIWITKHQCLCQGDGQGSVFAWDSLNKTSHIHFSAGYFFFLFVRRGWKGRRRFVHLGDALGTGLNLILCPDLSRLRSLPSSRTSECYLNVRSVFFSARQSKRKQILLLRVCKPNLGPGWLLFSSTVGSSSLLRQGMLQWAMEGQAQPGDEIKPVPFRSTELVKRS